LVYGIYALVTNIMSAGVTNLDAIVANYTDVLILSLGAKQLNINTENETYYYIQCWLGVAAIAIWIVTFILLKYL